MRPVAVRRRDPDAHSAERARLDERVRDVVAVADVRELEAGETAETLLEREQIRERLARVVLVGEGVHDRYARGGRRAARASAARTCGRRSPTRSRRGRAQCPRATLRGRAGAPRAGARAGASRGAMRRPRTTSVCGSTACRRGARASLPGAPAARRSASSSSRPRGRGVDAAPRAPGPPDGGSPGAQRSPRA